jgi:hypothetical protein
MMAFDIHQRVFNEDGEYSEEAVDRYRQELMELFAHSPEGQELMGHGYGIVWADSFMGYGIDYLGTTPADMSPDEVEEIVFELFPQTDGACLSQDEVCASVCARFLR